VGDVFWRFPIEQVFEIGDEGVVFKQLLLGEVCAVRPQAALQTMDVVGVCEGLDKLELHDKPVPFRVWMKRSLHQMFNK
jgi:hypothetical protein